MRKFGCGSRMKKAVVDAINWRARKIPTWAVYIVCLMPVPYFLYLGMTGGLGREPINALEHELGALAFKLLLLAYASHLYDGLLASTSSSSAVSLAFWHFPMLYCTCWFGRC